MTPFIKEAEAGFGSQIEPILGLLGVNPGTLASEPSGKLHGILDKVASGRTIDREEALYLSGMDVREVAFLLLAASYVRERSKGDVITFSRNVFVPLTRLCRDRCGYCTFKVEPDEGVPLFMTPEEVTEVAKGGAALGCTELLFVTGDKPESSYRVYREALGRLGYKRTSEYLRDMCELGLEQENIFPHSNLGIADREELTFLREVNASMGLMLETISPRLLQKGEAHYGCPDKVPALRIKTTEEAGELGIAFTSGILVGISETWEERVDALYAIKDMQDRYGHIQEIIIQNFSPKPGIRMEKWLSPDFLDMIKVVSIARLIFGGEMNIQVPPNLNPKTYPLFVFAGVNDLGGVSPITIDYVNPEAPWPQVERMKEIVGKLGFTLKERLPIYPEFVMRGEEFMSRRVLRHIMDMDVIDEAGYVKEEESNGRNN